MLLRVIPQLSNFNKVKIFKRIKRNLFPKVYEKKVELLDKSNYELGTINVGKNNLR